MALSYSQTVALKGIIKPGMKVCSLGYPDIIAPIEMLVELFGTRMRYPEWREDSAAICKRHGLEERAIPSAESVFKLLGCELHVYDIVQERGTERLCDLNRPDDLKYAAEHYDIVLDVGTVEHCFNIGAAMFNMAGLVKLGGVIIHENPFNAPNHGFYNLNPTFFVDFYAANGFELLDCHLASRAGDSLKVPLTGRFMYTMQEMNIFAMARRTGIQSFVWPQQTKYAKVTPAAVENRAKEKENA